MVVDHRTLRSGRLFLVRSFIIFHDCGHGSFLSQEGKQYPWFYFRNVCFHPYHHWRWGTCHAPRNQRRFRTHAGLVTFGH